MGNTPSSSPTPNPPPSPFECVICTETVPPNKKFNNTLNNCSHPFCVDCIAHHIQVKVEEDKVADIKCPDIECGASLDPLTCRPILSVNLFGKWCDVLCESMLVMSQKSFYCPFSNCSAMLLNECGEDVTKSKCPVCKGMFCFRCKLPWHPGFGCTDAHANRDRNDLLFGQLVEIKKWTRCPVCRHFVERISGCSIVTCRCGVGFCYACGRRAQHGHICNRVLGRSVNIIYLLFTLFCLFMLFMYWSIWSI